MHVSEELERGHHEHHPYWKRAHHDWRFWVALVLMLAAMLIYVMTDDLSIAPHIRVSTGAVRHSRKHRSTIAACSGKRNLLNPSVLEKALS